MNSQPVCLTIAGLDPSGGAGIIADIKTFSAFGCFGTAAITSLTFQNTTGVFGAVHQTAESVRGQAQAVLDDMQVVAIKTGMLPTREVIEETARLIRESGVTNVVVDPVVRSTSGFDLIDSDALESMLRTLFPLALIVTPNLVEAERICGFEIADDSAVQRAGQLMLNVGAQNVLIKGGHSRQDQGRAIDHLFHEDEISAFEKPYIETDATHGTGCTLAAAITANLAHGRSIKESVGVAKDFVYEGIRTAPGHGRGHSPINIPNYFASGTKVGDT